MTPSPCWEGSCAGYSCRYGELRDNLASRHLYRYSCQHQQRTFLKVFDSIVNLGFLKVPNLVYLSGDTNPT